MSPGESTRNFYRNQGAIEERERVIQIIIRELKNEEWSVHSIASLVGAIERG